MYIPDALYSTAYDVEGQQLYVHGYELDCKTVTVRWLIE